MILDYLSQQIAKIKLMKNTRCYYLEDTIAGPLCKEIRIDSFMVDFPASHVVHMVDFPASHVSFHGVILTPLLFWAPFSCNLELLVPKNSQSKMHSFLAPNKSQVNSHQRVEGQEFTRLWFVSFDFFLGGSGDRLTLTKRAKESSELGFFARWFEIHVLKV